MELYKLAIAGNTLAKSSSKVLSDRAVTMLSGQHTPMYLRRGKTLIRERTVHEVQC